MVRAMPRAKLAVPLCHLLGPVTQGPQPGGGSSGSGEGVWSLTRDCFPGAILPHHRPGGLSLLSDSPGPGSSPVPLPPVPVCHRSRSSARRVTGREWEFLPVNLVSEPLLLASLNSSMAGSERRRGGGRAGSGPRSRGESDSRPPG